MLSFISKMLSFISRTMLSFVSKNRRYIIYLVVVAITSVFAVPFIKQNFFPELVWWYWACLFMGLDLLYSQ